MPASPPPEHALAEYAAALSCDDLDSGTRRRVVDIVFDTVGVGIGACVAGHDSGRLTEAFVLGEGDTPAPGTGSATLWSGRGKGTPGAVALCNGTWAEVLDYQDTVVDPRNNGHAAVTIVPAALAVAEQAGAGGRALVAAVAAGLEVTIAILRAVGRAHRADGRGFRTTSIAAPVGAATACAKLLGLPRAGLLNAMGLSGACAPNGLMPSLSPANGAFGMDKDWVNGLAARLAVESALLAARGMSASDRVVSGERGIVASHAHGESLELRVPSGGAPNVAAVALKHYAACYGVHTAMEAAAAIVAEQRLTAGEVDSVVVGVKADSAETLGGRTIANHMAARFSLPYAVAVAITGGAGASLRAFEVPAIHDPEVLAFMDRIRVIGDPELTHFHARTGGFPARVELRARGSVYERRIDYPPGSSQRPMSRAQLAAKFRELTPGRWSEQRREEIVSRGLALDELDDVREFTSLL